ncbi:MAG TPA: hypothetical protein PJ988_16020 [Anaerolinea sp.]|nr:hypothetical protein [Anaerolinea sp.]
MPDGINLSLMIGPAVPVPVSKDVLDALERLEVTSSAGQASGFQLVFKIDRDSPIAALFLLAGGAAIPLVRVIIAVTVNGISEVLMDGVMTQHQFSPGGGDGKASLTITGEDLSRVMNFIDFSGIPYPAMPPELRVLTVLGKYAVFGIVPMVIPTVMMDIPNPLERIPRHSGTDLAYIRELAGQAGYVFYVDPGPVVGVSRAYWGPDVKVGVPQPALNVNADVQTNVEAINFTFNDSQAELPVVYIQNSLTKTPIPIPIPDVSLINPPLGLVPPIPKKVTPITGLAKANPVQAVLFGLAQRSQASEAVSASGSLDVARYGHVLKSRGLVGLRGAGTLFDGLYYVKSVTHSIERGSYKQRFTLTRNGLVSTTARV